MPSWDSTAITTRQGSELRLSVEAKAEAVAEAAQQGALAAPLEAGRDWLDADRFAFHMDAIVRRR